MDDGTGNCGDMLCGLAQHESDIIITQSGTQLNPATNTLSQQQRGSVNVSSLGLLSSELTETTTIPNFPIPHSQWEWSAVGMGGAHTDELFLDQESEVDQSLFDPTKMIIAKVESLNEDSQFNEYLNEILESEGVMECLNSLNTDTSSLTTPQQLQTTTQELTASLQVQAGTAAKGLDASSSEKAGVYVPPSSAPATSSQALSSGGDVDQSCAESVAAYVAAETNLVPFTVTDCLQTNVDTGSEAGPTNGCLGSVGISAHSKAVKPDMDVMWSQAGIKKTSVQPPKPSKQQPSQSLPQPPPAESSAPSIAAEPPQEKRRIFRVKRGLKNKKGVNSNTSDAGKSESSSKKGKVRPLTIDIQPPELKSRKGRLIKPSWKVVQTNSTQSLKLPDIPTTPSPNPPVSLSTSSMFSMSLDDVLRQMNDSPQEEESLDLNFAESLLANVPPAGTEHGQREEKEEFAHMTAGNKEKSNNSETLLDTSMNTLDNTKLNLQGFVTTPLPPVPQCNEPAKMEGQSGSLVDFCITSLQQDDLCDPMKDSSCDAETQLKDVNTSVTRGEDNCIAIGMDLYDTDTAEDEVLCSTSVKNQHGQSWTKPLLHEPKAAEDSEDEEVEDRIDLFVEDIDAFTVYTMDEEKKYNTPPQMPTPPSKY